jgi:WD40 repeat protein
LASASYDNTIKIWDSVNGTVLKTLKSLTLINSLAVLSNNILASGSSDSTITIWDAVNWIELKTLGGHTSNVFCLALLSDKTLASGSYDETIKIWG